MKFRAILYIILFVSIVAVVFSVSYMGLKKDENHVLWQETIVKNIVQLKFVVPTLLYRNKDSNIISVNIMFKGGSFLDTYNYEGISEVLANVMLEATDKLTSLQMQELIADNSIKLSSYTTRDSIVFSISTLEKNKTKAFQLIHDIFSQNNFKQNNINIVKAKLLTNLNAVTRTPSYLINRTVRLSLYGISPLSAVMSSESLKRIDSNILKEFKNKVITKDNMYITLSGKINESDANSYLEDLINDIPNSSNKDIFILEKKEPEINGIKIINIPLNDIVQSDIAIILKAPFDILQNSQYANVINLYLGGSAQSLLFEELRNKSGLVYSVFSTIIDTEVSSFWYISLSTPLESADVAVASTINIVTNLSSSYLYNNIELSKNLLLNKELNNYLNNPSIAYYMNILQFKGKTVESYIENLREIKLLEESKIADFMSSLDTTDILVVKTILAN